MDVHPNGQPEEQFEIDLDAVIAEFGQDLARARWDAATQRQRADELARRLDQRTRQVEALAARVSKLEGLDEPTNVDPDVAPDTYADVEPEEARP